VHDRLSGRCEPAKPAYDARLVPYESADTPMHHVARTLLVAAAACLVGCATPEELAAATEKKAGRESQTGTNIARRDPAGRTSSVSDKDAQDAMINEMRNVPVKPVIGTGGTL